MAVINRGMIVTGQPFLRARRQKGPGKQETLMLYWRCW